MMRGVAWAGVGRDVEKGPVLATFATKLATVTSLEDSLAQAVSEKNAAREALEIATTKQGNYVENASNGVEATIQSAGFDVRAPGAPIGDLPAPANLVATMGDLAGEVDLACDRVHGAVSCIWHCRLDSAPNGPWQEMKVSRKSSTTAVGLVSGTKHAFRVATLNMGISDPPTQSEVQAIADKVDELINALRR